ncbi:hypothetical protein [Paenibacillus urinalis]|uniref:Uncharacterized protein n=1 Tax=Paenibacillus urinalis TaxID=521520 RepID=A0AAX3N159_9BACL|nr:hypothetical protein [Paenibacillus urinalis]WDH83353.1 hypothetical protein PUW23_03660 [Paenibacillus urinalis]
MLIVYIVVMTDEQKKAVRDAVMDLDDDEFLILLQYNQAIYGDKKTGRVVIREVMNYF